MQKNKLLMGYSHTISLIHMLRVLLLASVVIDCYLSLSYGGVYSLSLIHTLISALNDKRSAVNTLHKPYQYIDKLPCLCINNRCCRLNFVSSYMNTYTGNPSIVKKCVNTNL